MLLFAYAVGTLGPTVRPREHFLFSGKFRVFFRTYSKKIYYITRAGALPGDPEAEAVEALCPVGRPRVEGPRRADVIELGATDHQEGVLGGKEKEEVQSVKKAPPRAASSSQDKTEILLY